MHIHVITRWRTRVLLSRLVAVLLLLALIISLAACARGLIRAGQRLSLPVPGYTALLSPPILEGILNQGLPTLYLQAAFKPGTAPDLATGMQALTLPAGIFPRDTGAARFLTAGEDYNLPPAENLPVESPPPAPVVKSTPPAGNPLVAIYTTHNAESYRSGQGEAKTPGKNGDISQVAAVLAETLDKDYGIPTIRSTTIHDYPDFALAYANSEKTLQKMLAENPSVMVALDIHRNAGVPVPPVAEIDNQRVAGILIIVGSDARQEHPNWRQNEAFARRLAQKMDAFYPGLSLGVRVQEGRYNQHLHPRALLLEIGCDNNTLEEAERAARLLGRVLAALIEDLRRENPAKSG